LHASTIVTPCALQVPPAQVNKNAFALVNGASCRMQNRSTPAFPATCLTMVCARGMSLDMEGLGG
jgi:hypothetical protein